MAAKARVNKWDNIKCVLIILVVIGHFANQFEDHSEIMRMISLFIYTFHMPLFIFMSGLLERKWSAGREFKLNKVVFYVMIGYALKVLIYLIKISFGKTPEFNWLSDTGIPWYMFAMAAFYVMVYLVRKADWRVVLGVSILIACLAGYCNQIGSFLSMSRIIVFFPFYYLGYILKPEEILKFSEKRWVKELSFGVLVSGAVICIVFIEDLYTYIRLFTGRNPYDFINHGDCGFVQRLIFFAVAILMGWAVLNLIPETHHELMSKIGSRTLQIYFWHRLVLYIIMYTGFADSIQDTCGAGWIAIYLMLAILLTLVLSEGVFNIPLKWLQNFAYSFSGNVTSRLGVRTA